MTQLEVIFENWRGYQEKLRNCVAPLTNEQLLLQPAPHMWPLGQIVQHIISVRAGCFTSNNQDHYEAAKIRGNKASKFAMPSRFALLFWRESACTYGLLVSPAARFELSVVVNYGLIRA